MNMSVTLQADLEKKLISEKEEELKENADSDEKHGRTSR